MRPSCYALLAFVLSAHGAFAASDVPPFGQSRFPVCGVAVDPAVPVCREAAPIAPTLAEGASVRLDGNRLLIAYQGDAKSVQLIGELVPEPLARIDDKRWLRVLRIADPAAFYLRVGFLITPEAGMPRSQIVEVAGPAYVAPPPPRRRALQQLPINSKHMGGARMLRVWLSPNYSATASAPAHVVYIGDGAADMAQGLDARIAAGDLPPLVVVGLVPCNTATPEMTNPGCRNREYENEPIGSTRDPSVFLAHEKFFFEEVIPAIEQTFNVSRHPADRAVAGFSGGADWAVSMAMRHPALFSYAIVMSPSRGVYDVLPATPALPPINITAGVFEPDMVRGGGCLAGMLAQAGAPVRMTTLPYGHAAAMWHAVFAARVIDWLGGALPPATPGLVRAATCWPRVSQPV